MTSAAQAYRLLIPKFVVFAFQLMEIEFSQVQS